MNPALTNRMSKFSAPSPCSPRGGGQDIANLHSDEKCSNIKYADKILSHRRDADGQASGGDDAGSDDWIFNTIREKDLKKVQNGAAQPAELERKQVRTMKKERVMNE